MTVLHSLLVRTSRTFALAVPLLPAPLCHEVTLAYLLFRVADTCEDAAAWPRSKRLEALSDLASLLRSRSPEEARRLSAAWTASPPGEHEGYLELLRELPRVIDELEALPPERREVITRHALRTTDGMAGFVASGEDDGSLRLSTLTDLRRYCYTVAGIVGELLTDLILLDSPQLSAAGPALRERSAAFGEGLQLVNILKDAGDDARDGRVYLPPDTERAQVFALARADLRAAIEYVTLLTRHGAPLGYVRFTALPVLLARATLDRLEQQGAGAKLSRDEVALAMHRLEHALTEGAPVLFDA